MWTFILRLLSRSVQPVGVVSARGGPGPAAAGVGRQLGELTCVSCACSACTLAAVASSFGRSTLVARAGGACRLLIEPRLQWLDLLGQACPGAACGFARQTVGRLLDALVLIVVRLAHAPRVVDEHDHVGPALALETQLQLRQQHGQRRAGSGRGAGRPAAPCTARTRLAPRAR